MVRHLRARVPLRSALALQVPLLVGLSVRVTVRITVRVTVRITVRVTLRITVRVTLRITGRVMVRITGRVGSGPRVSPSADSAASAARAGSRPREAAPWPGAPA